MPFRHLFLSVNAVHKSKILTYKTTLRVIRRLEEGRVNDDGTPQSLQGRGQYEANDPKLKQTRASTLELQNSLPQDLRKKNLLEHNRPHDSRP